MARCALRIRGAFIAALAAFLSSQALAQTADFPKTINIFVGYGSGGGYDTSARLVARHWGNHLPGRPAVVVQNMPGAGGLRVANWLYSAAPADGSAVAITGSPNFLSPLYDGKGVQFDPLRFSYLASLSGEAAACAVWHTAGAASLDDLKRVEVLAGASGPSSVSTVYPLALNAVLGTRFKLVQGYTGSAQAILSMEKGEIHAFCGWTHHAQPDWVREKKVYLVAQIALAPDPFFPNVALALDHAQTPQDRQVLELIFAPQMITRPYLAPPGVPSERVKILRDGLAAMSADPNYRSDAAKLNMEPSHMSGDEVTEVLRRLYASPPSVVARAKAIINP